MDRWRYAAACENQTNVDSTLYYKPKSTIHYELILLHARMPFPPYVACLVVISNRISTRYATAQYQNPVVPLPSIYSFFAR